MTLADLTTSLPVETFFTPTELEHIDIQHVVASDLMSDVLVAHHVEHFILVTSLASDQMMRTADLVGAAGVILVNNKQPPQSLIRLAEDLGLPLLGTALPKFETCLTIGTALFQEQKT